MITYGEDSLRQEGKKEVLELEEQFNSNRKFKKVLTLVFEIFESFILKPSFMERMNFSFMFREFVIDRYILWRSEGKRIKALGDMQTSKEVDRVKAYWVDLVRLYNSLSGKLEDFHVLLHKINSFIEQYQDIRALFGEDLLIEVVKISTKFLFCQKLFKECNLLLTNVLSSKEEKSAHMADYKMFDKLQIACLRASSDNQIVVEIEDIAKTTTVNSTQRRKTFEAEEVLETENRVLSPQEIHEKLQAFEKMTLKDQIDKADSYLLAFLISQRRSWSGNLRGKRL